MSRTQRNDDELSYVARTLRETEKGVQVRVRGKELWFPKSRAGKWPPEGQAGTLVIPRWLALQHGLAKPDDEAPGPASMADEPETGDADDRAHLPRDTRLDTMEVDLTAVARMQAKLVRAIAAITRGLQGLHDKDPVVVGDAIAEATRAMSSSPMDRPAETEEERKGAPF